MLTNNSNRLLKNVHDWNDTFARILTYNETDDKFEQNRILKYGDIVADSTEYNLNYFGEGEATIYFKNQEYYEILINLCDTVPTMIEIAVPETETKLYYFFVRYEFKRNFEDQSREMSVTFESFVNMVEKNTVIEHTIEYTYAQLPVDDQGQKQEPDDLNKIYYKDMEFIEIMNNLYVQNSILNPVDRNRGGIHTYTTEKSLSRLVKGLRLLSFEPHDFNYPMTVYDDKKTLFEYRSSLQDELIDQSPNNVVIPILELAGDLLNCRFYQFPNIDVINNETKDRPISFDITRDTSTHKKAILMEGDYLLYSSQFYSNLPSYQFKKKEDIGSCQVPAEWKVNNEYAGEISNYIADKARQLSRVNEITNSTIIQIDFWNKKFFQDIKAGQVINISGYDYLDGSYLIKNITAKVNQTYTEFVMDDLEKI